MAHASFVHLRVHSAYSLTEGAIPVKSLVKSVAEMKMPAVAVTDTNNMFGALEFSGVAAKSGVQPIIGGQFSLLREKAAGSEGFSGAAARSAQAPDWDEIVLLAQNETGYQNLLKLLSYAYLDDQENDDPLIPMAILEKFSEGVILLTGGPNGPIGHLLLAGQTEAAEQMLLRLKEAFEDRLYIEIMRHGLEAEKQSEKGFLDLAFRHDVPIVATNEVFFGDASMYEAHDALICIAAGAYIAQSERRRLTPQHYLKNATEMRSLFADLPEAVDNTLVIAKRSAWMVESIAPLLPPYDCGEGRDEADELREQAHLGLDVRLEKVVYQYHDDLDDEKKKEVAEPYRRRLDYELDVINEMGFPGYFLIVYDFINWAKKNGIPVGPGRGSGAGSVAAWALSITDLDPLRFGLLFERFLNPERVSMPDFDIDFCQDRRGEVIHYVQQKYGRDHVAQIITFGKLQAKAVIRDVGRVLEMPYGYIDKISKLIPNNPANPVDLEHALIAEPELRRLISEDPAVERLFGIARKLEGLYRNASTHAAGVVIGDRPLDKLIPLYRDPRSEMPVSGFNMKFVESAGLVKFDFLGLKTLTVLATAEDLIREKGIEIDVNHLPLDDSKTFEMIGRGETTGVFQLESSGMRDVLKKMRADTFEDIIAIVALYRPGPMENIPSYIRRKHGEEEPDYMYPTLEGILKETFGIMIYQEQVMQVAQELAGYSLGGADLLRRAMGKKIKEEMDLQRQVFVDGAKSKGVPEKKAHDIFDQVNMFAGYGFNKSHAAAYALVAYQTAYLKANHPVEFLAASMTLDLTNTDKLNVFRQELDRQSIAILIPDINKSDVAFKVEREGQGESGAIRYALAAIKNVGEAAMATLVLERQENGPFNSVAEFANRIDTSAINKRQLENLVRAGAFDQLDANRQRVFSGVESILRHANLAQSERNSDQISLFGEQTIQTAGLTLPDVPDWPSMERLREEFNAVGFYLSAHPLDAYAKILSRMKVVSSAEVIARGESVPVKLAGTVIAKKERMSQKGNRYAFVQCSDSSGVYEVTVFSETLTEAGELLDVGNSIIVHGSAQFEGDTPRITVQRIESVDKAAANGPASGLQIYLDSDKPLKPLQEVLVRGGKGRGRVEIIARTAHDREVELKLAESYSISPDIYLAIKAIPGVLDVHET